MNVIVAHPVDLMLTGIQAILGDAGVGEVRVCQSFNELKLGFEVKPPDVVVLDEQLEPELTVWEMIEQVQAASPARIVLLGSISDGYWIQNLCEMGVMAYLYQYDSVAASLVEALETVIADRQYLSQTAMAEYLWAMQNPRSVTLEPTERQILRGLANGERPKEIAAAMGKKTRLVYEVTERLRGQFGVTSTQELVLKVATENLI